jgi:hypothetical protein
MVYRNMIFFLKQISKYDHEITVRDVLTTSIILTCMDNGHLQVHYRTLNNPHSVHDGSSLSRQTLLPIFFPLHDAVVSSSPAWRLTAYLTPCLGGRALPCPPTWVDPIFLRFQATSRSSVGYRGGASGQQKKNIILQSDDTNYMLCGHKQGITARDLIQQRL